MYEFIDEEGKLIFVNSCGGLDVINPFFFFREICSLCM